MRGSHCPTGTIRKSTAAIVSLSWRPPEPLSWSEHFWESKVYDPMLLLTPRDTLSPCWCAQYLSPHISSFALFLFYFMHSPSKLGDYEAFAMLTREGAEEHPVGRTRKYDINTSENENLHAKKPAINTPGNTKLTKCTG